MKAKERADRPSYVPAPVLPATTVARIVTPEWDITTTTDIAIHHRTNYLMQNLLSTETKRPMNE
uniref:Uncharacterized protein n=1 Tax=Arion vulgaris TaxID=1028688 RepID=A0A0B7AL11_9EUPU